MAGVDLGDGTFTAPHVVEQGVKVLHLRMAPVQWEVSPGVVMEAWTFNGTVPGPTLRINEGDRVRFVVQNDLPEMTGVHWHGMVLPNDQDGVPHLTQNPIMPGETFTYEWTAVSGSGGAWRAGGPGGSGDFAEALAGRRTSAAPGLRAGTRAGRPLHVPRDRRQQRKRIRVRG
ncbi:MAG: multicopper oxidase domain-containing protein [Pseudonocardiaceae bacterium]